MRKLNLALIMIVLFSTNIFAQKFITKTGHVWFYSKTSLEVIEAHNNQTASVIDTKTNEIAFNINIKSFKFERALMEEHFNENYMESGKYPKSTFKGKFTDFDSRNYTKNGTYKTNVEGDLTIHGSTKHIKVAGTLEVKDGKLIAKAKFKVKPEEYGIDIPSLVRDKISQNMEVNVDITYDSMK